MRVVAAGDALIAPTIIKRLIEQFSRTAPPRLAPDRFAALTPREFETFTLIGRGFSNAEIASTLTLSQATVKTRVKRSCRSSTSETASTPSYSPTKQAS